MESVAGPERTIRTHLPSRPPAAPAAGARLAIVLLNYNGLADTRKCLASLEPQCDAAVDVVVVDNCSKSDPTEELAREFAFCHILRNSRNDGWAGGNNVGIVYARRRGADLVALLNNDTVAAPTLVRRLRDVHRMRPEFGVFGPVIHFMDEPDAVMTDGCRFEPLAGAGYFARQTVPARAFSPADGEAVQFAPPMEETDVVNGCCLVARREVFEQIGLIDERFFLVHEETDFCLRARRAGFKLGVLAETLIWHKGSSTFKATGRAWQRYFDSRNLGLLLSKHPRDRAGRQSSVGLMLKYLRYVYHQFSFWQEAGEEPTSRAVVQGLYDACARRFGSLPTSSRWGEEALFRLFRSLHSWRTAGRPAERNAPPSSKG